MESFRIQRRREAVYKGRGAGGWCRWRKGLLAHLGRLPREKGTDLPMSLRSEGGFGRRIRECVSALQALGYRGAINLGLRSSDSLRPRL